MKVDLSVLGNPAAGYVLSEWLPDLVGLRAMQTYKRMRDNEAIIGAAMLAVETLMKRVEFRVEPNPNARAKSRAKAEAEFITGCMNDMTHTFATFMAQVTTAVVYGNAPFEIVWKRRRGPTEQNAQYYSAFDDNRLSWRKIELRPQESIQDWVRDAGGDVIGFTQYTNAGPVDITGARALIITLGDRPSDPTGRSMLRNSYRPWYFKTKMEEIEAIGIERDLAGLPVMEVPADMLGPDATAADKTLLAQFEQVLAGIRADTRAYAIIPSEKEVADDQDGKPTEFSSGYKLRLLTSGGARAHDVDKTIRRYEQRIAMTLLAEFLMLGVDKSGSYALSDDKTTLFGIALGAIMDYVCESFTRHAIRPAMELNGVAPDQWPSLQHGPLLAKDVAAFALALKNLADADFVRPDDDLENYVRDQLELPKRTNTRAEQAAENMAQNQAALGGQTPDGQTPQAAPGGTGDGGGETGGGSGKGTASPANGSTPANGGQS